jgi:hypothetical protein
MKTTMRRTVATAILVWIVTPAALPAALLSLADTRHVDLGDISSTGESGRQLHIRPLRDSDVGRSWVYFPPHRQLPDIFPDPTPPSPRQDSLFLTEATPLVVVIPQLQHKPMVGRIDIDYYLDGNILTINASLHLLPAVTATIYGPHEFLLPIGELPAGDYRLRFNMTRTYDYSDSELTTTGFADFQVHGVPEPATTSLAVVGFVIVGLCGRRTWRRKAS